MPSSVDYGYDAAGNRTTMTWPGGGSLSYTYDQLNRMDTVTKGRARLRRGGNQAFRRLTNHAKLRVRSVEAQKSQDRQRGHHQIRLGWR